MTTKPPLPAKAEIETVEVLTPLPAPTTGTVATVPPEGRDSLSAWVHLYGTMEANANAANTLMAKGRDLKLFMQFVHGSLHSDHPDDWTKSVTSAFLRHLENNRVMKPNSVNRALSTLRHCAAWIHRHRPFLAGNPTDKVKELTTDEPTWKGLADVEVMRLKCASEQLVPLKGRKNQDPLRDRAVFLVLLHTGLRVSELLGLAVRQYSGKHFQDVKRKGKVRTARVFVPPEAREALDLHLAARGSGEGPLFQTRAGGRLRRQHVDRLLKQLAAQANSKLAADQRIRLSAHVLRHTFLRKVTEKKGVAFAMESAGHASSKYIWRYVKPSEEEKEKALEELF